MPMVGGKEYPYTKSGKAAAKKAKAKAKAMGADAKKAALKNWLYGMKKSK
jgi:hypothetical protein